MKKLIASLSAGTLALTAFTATTSAQAQAPTRQPTAIGYGGAVSSVDPDATNIGLDVLRRGGNAVDAAVATAAALGVTEPYSAGIGGGGYFVYYNAKSHRVTTIDGRETAPATMPSDAFVDKQTGQPYQFANAVTSGVSIGVPGTLATWNSALQQWGSLSLGNALKPAADLAERGFVVDPTFRLQTLENKSRFAQVVPTAKLFLPNGDAPQVGSLFKNPELAATYKLIGQQGPSVFYNGQLSGEMAAVAKNPPKTADATLPFYPGYLQTSDLSSYQAIDRAPTKVRYDGLDIYGMPPSSSGGITVGEALNILQPQHIARMSTTQALHTYLEASALAFADRGAYIGDPAYVDVPQQELLSKGFGAERSCLIDPRKAATKPVPAGSPDGSYLRCGKGSAVEQRSDTEGRSTTHLVTADKWGNVVSYTLTIEQTGGSGITVPGRGFLLNNELTDFSFAPNPKDPNIVMGGKRPRSSMSPTIVLRGNQPYIAIGSPGGSTIITTVLQTLTNRLDRGMTLPQAIAAPRASQRNTASVTAEQSFIDQYGAALAPYGHTFTPAGAPGSSAAEIGAVAALEFLPGGAILAAAEPTRRGGGDAGVVRAR
ncbi:gamma-glutamyltransferase [Kribbella sp. GL6]|uniref:gamma-glutamyltransferase n=1 Tax=Kribbella sp. GL6 TaxID=3419765 RepID=UPI003D0305E4